MSIVSLAWRNLAQLGPGLSRSDVSTRHRCQCAHPPSSAMAEYEALIFGLSATLSLGIRQLLVKGDSQLIIKQVCGECSCNELRLVAYLLM
jgi:ribonuclease HI